MTKVDLFKNLIKFIELNGNDNMCVVRDLVTDTEECHLLPDDTTPISKHDLCLNINCSQCPFDTGNKSKAIQHIKDILPHYQTLELLEIQEEDYVDS